MAARPTAADLKQTHRRRGKWLAQEAAFADLLIEQFNLGLLPIARGTTLRSFLASSLNCDAMRISKRYARGDTLGKRLYLAVATEPATLAAALAQRESAEAAFWEAVAEVEAVAAARRGRRPASDMSPSASSAAVASPSSSSDEEPARKKRSGVRPPAPLAVSVAPPQQQPHFAPAPLLGDIDLALVFGDMQHSTPFLNIPAAAAPMDALPVFGRSSELEEDLLLLLQDSCPPLSPTDNACASGFSCYGDKSPDAPSTAMFSDHLPVPDLELPAMALW